MPFNSDPNLDDQDKASGSGAQGQAAGQVSGQPGIVSGATGSQTQSQTLNSATEAPEAPKLASSSQGGTPGGQGMKAGSQPAYNPSAPTSSGQWTNLQSYLDANNGGQFGQNFSGNVGKQVTGAQNAVKDAATNFGSSVDGNTVQNNQALVDQVGSAPQNLTSDDQAAFKKQLNASYAGPENTAGDAGFQKANSAAHNAYEEAQAAQNPGGQQALLKKYYNTPTYKPGEQALDSAILSTDPNAQAAIQAMAKQASDLPVNYQNAVADANSRASTAAGTTAAAHQAAVDSLYGSGGSATDLRGGAIGNLQSGIDARVAKSRTDYDSQLKQIMAAFGTRDLSTVDPNVLREVGLDKVNLGGAATRVNAPSYLKGVGEENINRRTVANQDEYAKLNALMQLSGGQNTFLPDANGLGTFDPAKDITFDSDGFDKAVRDAQPGYDADAQRTINVINHENPWLR